MADMKEKKTRKNRTYLARVEEIQELYGRKPTAFELRALAEFPLTTVSEEPYDSSTNGRRIRELLVLSEQYRDVSYLDEAGAMIAYQAMRNPYSEDPEPLWDYPKAKHKPTHSSELPTSPGTPRVPDLQNIPPLSPSAPLSSPYDPPLLPSVLLPAPAIPLRCPQPHDLPQKRLSVTPQHHARISLGHLAGVSLSAPDTHPKTLPVYNDLAAWDHNQFHQDYHTNNPRPYSLPKTYTNTNSYQTLEYHTNRLSHSNGCGSNPRDTSQPQPQCDLHELPSTAQANLHNHQPVGHQNSGVPPVRVCQVTKAVGTPQPPLGHIRETGGKWTNSHRTPFQPSETLPTSNIVSNGVINALPKTFSSYVDQTHPQSSLVLDASVSDMPSVNQTTSNLTAGSHPPPSILINNVGTLNYHSVNEQWSSMPVGGHPNLLDPATPPLVYQFDLNNRLPEAHQSFNNGRDDNSAPVPRMVPRAFFPATLSTQYGSNNHFDRVKRRNHDQYLKDLNDGTSPPSRKSKRPTESQNE